MNIEWEQDWHMSSEEVRAKYGIVPFAGAFPADLLEQLSQAPRVNFALATLC